jgi:hypothetical protein
MYCNFNTEYLIKKAGEKKPVIKPPFRGWGVGLALRKG